MLLSELVKSLSQEPALLMVTILGSMGLFAGIVISSVSFVSEAWRRVRQTEEDNALKQAMLDRGMSAEEIATVIKASSEPSASVMFRAGKAGMRCRT